MKNTVKNVAAKSTKTINPVTAAIEATTLDMKDAAIQSQIAKLTKEMASAKKAHCSHEASAIAAEIAKLSDAKQKVAAKKATPKKVAAKKATPKKVAAKKATPVERKAPIADNKVIVKLVDSNPRAEGSIGHASFSLIKKGMTIAQYLSKGGRRKDLCWDLKHKYVKVV